MKRDERAELERQGAKAAARGDDARSNPLLEHANMPVETGESTREWVARCDAWKAGYEWQRDGARDAVAGCDDAPQQPSHSSPRHE